MKKLFWFTHTNIDARKVQSIPSISTSKVDVPSVSFNLTEFLSVFIENELWNKNKYRTEYIKDCNKSDFERIQSIKINIHSKGSPYSNNHDYENVLNSYFDIEKCEHSKITSSGINEAFHIAVVEVKFNSDNKVIDYLKYEEEKDIDVFAEKYLTEENFNSYFELVRIKSIVCEFIQFFIFNLHLNFLTKDYDFRFTDKPNLTGFTLVTENEKFYYETDKIDFLAHYSLYEKNKDIVQDLMRITSKFWHREIPSIHFFLDALQGINITSTNFIKLVFTLESFFKKNTSKDYISLALPIILSNRNYSKQEIRRIIETSFSLRNEIVHGGKIHNISKDSIFKKGKENIDTSRLFYELKNLIVHIFYFYINNSLFLKVDISKINHDIIFKFLSSERKEDLIKLKYSKK